MCPSPGVDGVAAASMQYIQPLINKYKLVLKTKDTQLLRRFCDRALYNPESCRAEALIYWFLSNCAVNVVINEHPREGGPDFRCGSEGREFFLEVTSLSADAVARESGIPNVARAGVEILSPISRTLFEKAISKVPQLARIGKPSILAITTEHLLGSAFMDETATRNLLTGREYFCVPIGEPKRPMWVETALEDSVFYSREYDSPADHCRRDISAILLVHITSSGLRPIGALNPAASFPFSAQALSSVLFFSVSQQPDVDSPVIRLERNNPGEPEYMQFPIHE